MMVMLLLPVALMALIAWFKTRRSIAAAMLLAVGIVYFAALTLISIDPYFEHNGSIEYMEWRYRFVLALEVAGWLTPVTFPLILLVRAVLTRLKSGTRR